MITVKELRDMLEEYDDDDIVVLALDSDEYSPLEDVTSGHYIPESDWKGDFVDLDEVESDDKINLNGASRAIALWPLD